MNITDLSMFWEEILEKTREHMNEMMWKQWICGALLPVGLTDNVLTLGVTQNFLKTWVENNALSILQKAATDIAQEPITIHIVNIAVSAPPAPPAPVYPAQPVMQQPPAAPPVPAYTAPEPAAPAVPEVSAMPPLPTKADLSGSLFPDEAGIPVPEPVKPAAPEPAQVPDSYLNPQYTFDKFIIGNSNRVAYSAALAVAEAPAKRHNPLFIYGNSGLGKTHLMHAIGHYIQEHQPQLKVMCITSEKFTNDYITAMVRKGDPEAFRQKYRNIDVLLVDDIQFLEEKKGSQEEFFHTFNELHQFNKQIVLTSDRPPSNITKLEDRLRTRFEMGLPTSIQTPDMETRIAILRKRAEETNMKFDKEAIDFIAKNIDDNIRRLEGAFNRVLTYASLSQVQTVTLEFTKNTLKDIITEETAYITIPFIQETVCAYFNIKLSDLLGKKKTKNIAHPRQIAMYLCRELTPTTFPQIGQVFGGRDHTTVIHAHDKITREMESDPQIKETVGKLKEKLSAGTVDK